VPYCPRCGTPLSSQEVAQGYKDVKERSAVVKFKAKGEDAYFLAWTTTPWTLPSNVALCVNPAEDYVKIKVEDGTVYYMAQALVEKFRSRREVRRRTSVPYLTVTGTGTKVRYVSKRNEGR